MQIPNKCSIISVQADGLAFYKGVVALDERTRYNVDMTNEQYRAELKALFNSTDDNRLLRYFYIFVSEKMRRVLGGSYIENEKES